MQLQFLAQKRYDVIQLVSDSGLVVGRWTVGDDEWVDWCFGPAGDAPAAEQADEEAIADEIDEA